MEPKIGIVQNAYTSHICIKRKSELQTLGQFS